MKTRIEHDLLGDLAVPADAWYGIQTQRALDNFSITGVPISHFPALVRALVQVKWAAAWANRELGVLPTEKADAIMAACEEIDAGYLHDQFVVDLIQGGAGTSTNMNANEVIAADLAVTLAAEAGQLQLNAMEPLIVYNLLNSIKMLTAACTMLEERCIRGIRANEEQCARHLNNSIGIVTALVPHIGYSNATRIASSALTTGATVRELVLAEQLLPEAQLDALLSPHAMLAPARVSPA